MAWHLSVHRAWSRGGGWSNFQLLGWLRPSLKERNPALILDKALYVYLLFQCFFYLFTSEDDTIDIMKLALDSIISKYIQRMHSNSTVKYLPDNFFVCRKCVVADSLEFQMLYELLIWANEFWPTYKIIQLILKININT